MPVRAPSKVEITRRQLGLSQAQLAEKAGVTSDTISRIERGYEPTLATARAICRVFEVDLRFFEEA